jgi:hypothetical protein
VKDESWEVEGKWVIVKYRRSIEVDPSAYVGIVQEKGQVYIDLLCSSQ